MHPLWNIQAIRVDSVSGAQPKCSRNCESYFQIFVIFIKWRRRMRRMRQRGCRRAGVQLLPKFNGLLCWSGQYSNIRHMFLCKRWSCTCCSNFEQFHLSFIGFEGEFQIAIRRGRIITKSHFHECQMWHIAWYMKGLHIQVCQPNHVRICLENMTQIVLCRLQQVPLNNGTWVQRDCDIYKWKGDTSCSRTWGPKLQIPPKNKEKKDPYLVMIGHGFWVSPPCLRLPWWLGPAEGQSLQRSHQDAWALEARALLPRAACLRTSQKWPSRSHRVPWAQQPPSKPMTLPPLKDGAWIFGCRRFDVWIFSKAPSSFFEGRCSLGLFPEPFRRSCLPHTLPLCHWTSSPPPVLENNNVNESMGQWPWAQG